MYNNITVWPAYGRDYKSKKAVLDDWNAGKDFNSNEGYVSKRSKLSGYTHIHFRYKRKEMVAVLNLATGRFV